MNTRTRLGAWMACRGAACRRRLATLAILLAAGTAAGGTNYVSPGGSHTPPYDTWATAANDIRTAVDYASTNYPAYDTVLVTNGTYNVTSQITVTNAITVRSVNGAAGTTVAAPGSPTVTRVFKIAHASTVLEGFTIQNGYLTTADADPKGAGICMTGGTVRDCVITNNTTAVLNSGGNGSGVWMDGGVLESCTIIHNRPGGNVNLGAGVYMQNGALATHCVIVDNAFNNAYACAGAGVYMADTGCALRNSLLYDNNAVTANGGGVYGGTVQSCTIVGNSAGSGGGVYGATVINSVVRDNTAPESATANYAGSSSLSYSCTLPLPGAGAGNTAGDPQFVDATAHNYRVYPGSPCQDSGSVQAWMSGAQDLDGNARVYNATPDMGVYELTPGALSCSFTADVVLGLEPLDVVLTSSVLGTNMTSLYYRWDFENDGNVDVEGADKAVITNAFDAGSYDILLSVSNAAAETATRLREDYVVATKSTLYVADGNAGAQAPYTNWAAAAANLPEAVALATDGCEVLVSNGTYNITARILVEDAVTIRGVNGADVTTVAAGGATTKIRVFELDHPDAVLDGLTVRGGFLDVNYQLGAGIYMTGGLVRNCIITNNNIDAQYVSGGGVYMDGGVLTNCQVVGNVQSGGNVDQGVGIYMLNGAVATDCVIANNQFTANTYFCKGAGVRMADTSCVVRNSLIYGNDDNGNTGQQALGGGVYGGRIENCTVANNQAYYGGGVHSCVVTNSIVYGNTATDVGSPQYSGGSFDYSCTTPDPGSGVGNQIADPKFVGAATNNFRLLPSSPCIDAGTNLAWMASAQDPDGRDRILNGTVDIGVYEYEAGGLVCDFTADPEQGIAPLSVVLTASVGGDTNGLVYQWDFEDDGSVDEAGGDKGEVTHPYGAGVYSVSLSVSNGTGETASQSYSDLVVVTLDTVYVATNGTGVAPYTNWVTAATNLQDAVDVASEGVLVLVNDGVYDISVADAQVVVDKAITVRSVNGASNTVVRGPRPTQGTRGFYVDHTNAVVDGFTVESHYPGTAGGGIRLNNGAVLNCTVRHNQTASLPGGGIWMNTGTLVSNCVITANLVPGSSAGGGISSSGGIVLDSLIEANTNQNHWGGGAISAAGGRIERCIVRGNRTIGTSPTGGGMALSAGAVVRNCLVVDNLCSDSGGTIGKGGGLSANATVVIENCTVVSNAAAVEGGGVYGGVVSNSIVRLNAPDNYATATFSFSCTMPDPGGTGNITDDPLFADAAAGDYTLQVGSACVDSGTNQTWMVGAVDLAGNPRVVRGFSRTSYPDIVDMGAYEFPTPPPTGTMFVIR